MCDTHHNSERVMHKKALMGDTEEGRCLDQLGTIAPGKSADLVVFDANPFDSVADVCRFNAASLREQPVDRTVLRAERQWRMMQVGLDVRRARCAGCRRGPRGMIRKSGHRFSDKIMPQRNAGGPHMIQFQRIRR